METNNSNNNNNNKGDENKDKAKAGINLMEELTNLLLEATEDVQGVEDSEGLASLRMSLKRHSKMAQLMKQPHRDMSAHDKTVHLLSMALLDAVMEDIDFDTCLEEVRESLKPLL